MEVLKQNEAAQPPFDGELLSSNKWMSVRQMGELLGLKKVESYWLVHKNFFETTTAMGKMWVNTESFEKWYANQVKYHKITGEEPGSELKKSSYSARDIAQILDISESDVYEFLRKDHVNTVLVDYWKRVPRKDFDEWYRNQSRYRNAEDRRRDRKAERASLSMPQMAQVLGMERKNVYYLLDRSDYSFMFDSVIIAEKRRITKESIAKYLDLCLKKRFRNGEEIEDTKKRSQNTRRSVAEYRGKKRQLADNTRGIGNLDYLTLEEAAIYAGVTDQTILNWGNKGHIRVVSSGKVKRVPRAELEAWVTNRRSLIGYGIN